MAAARPTPRPPAAPRARLRAHRGEAPPPAPARRTRATPARAATRAGTAGPGLRGPCATCPCRRPGPRHRVPQRREWTRIWCVRPVIRSSSSSVQSRNRSRTRYPVTAGRPSGTTAMRLRSFGSRPIGASIRPIAADTGPRTRARYVLRTRRALSWAISPAWAASLRATISRPDVSRSSRWTIPGRGDPGDAAVVIAAGEQRVDQRPAPVAGRRVNDQPRRLVHDQDVVVLVDHLHRDRRIGLQVVRDLRRRHLERDRRRDRGPRSWRGGVGRCRPPAARR